MAGSLADAPILKRFRAALDDVYGERLDRVVLFGSRARGDSGAGSDYDVAVFLKDLPDPKREFCRLADLRVNFLDEDGVFFDAKPFSSSAWGDRTPLMSEIRRDGFAL